MDQTIGHYTLVRKLGEGAMGVVWAARDERLDRQVAIKLILKEGADPQARSRLWREARSAASISHPNVCHVYDVGEHEGELFVAMELLEGEPLSARIARGPLHPPEAVDAALAILGALGALHATGIVHRDLKPSNVFLTPHGIKLLDFGLARPLHRDDAAAVELTTPGMLVGTPRYMAPEQWAGRDVGPPADLFACGALLFEMLTARPAFGGASLAAICHAVVHENPPALAGGAEAQALDRVIQKAIAKDPGARWASAAAMATALRGARAEAEAGATLVTAIRPVTRLIVLPFRLLRADPEIDFLSVALPDAITSSLCGLESLVVRSTASAARWGSAEPDFRALASDAEVDAVLLGTLLRSGPQLRLATQLVEVPAGTVVWSKTLQAPLADVFELQDELAERVIESLAIPLSSRERSQLERDVPGTARAYELYLRANHLGVTVTSTANLRAARDLYRACVADDPRFAPAWARLGRIHRVMAKFGHGDWSENARLAEEAFRKALELNPDLPLAHSYFTYFEIEEHGDAPAAMTRLLGRVRARAADPEIFAGLVTVLRFCGLYEASLAADERARRLDPKIGTSAHYTLFMLGRWDEAAARDTDVPPLVRLCAEAFGSDPSGPLASLHGMIAAGMEGVEHHAVTYMTAALEGDVARVRESVDDILDLGFHDPEGIYFFARALSHAGDAGRAMELLDGVVRKNFCVHDSIAVDPWMEALRARAGIDAILEESRRRGAAAAAGFDAAGGRRLLGLGDADR